MFLQRSEKQKTENIKWKNQWLACRGSRLPKKWLWLAGSHISQTLLATSISEENLTDLGFTGSSESGGIQKIAMRECVKKDALID